MLYAQQVRPGEITYTDDNGITQMLTIDLNAPLMTTGNEDKEIRIVLPRHSNEVVKIYGLNVDSKEKDTAFDWFDIALHDEAETMKAKERKIDVQEATIRKQAERISELETEVEIHNIRRGINGRTA